MRAIRGGIRRHRRRSEPAAGLMAEPTAGSVDDRAIRTLTRPLIRPLTRVVAALCLTAACLVPATNATAQAAGDCRPDDGQGIAHVPATVPWPQTALGLTDDGVWTLTRGQGVVVAVVDTGVNPAGAVLPAAAVQAGISLMPGGGPGDLDCHGHGTMMAGVIAGRPGLASFEGVAPEATILPVTVTDETGDDPAAPGRIAAGIRWAVDHGARVVNVSITTTPDTAALDAAVRYAHDHNVLIVAASGNNTDAGPLYPASIPGVLAVGGIAADGSVYAQSEIGGNAGVAAPAAEVWSVGVQPGTSGSPYVLTGEGTSFASAFVAGTAALVLAARPGLTPDQVIHRIEATADRPASGTLPDPRIGWGVVDPYRAVTAELPGEQTTGTTGATGAGGGSASAATPQPMALPVAHATPMDTAHRVALLAIAGAVILGVAVPAAALAIRAGRRRGWAPGVRT